MRPHRLANWFWTPVAMATVAVALLAHPGDAAGDPKPDAGASALPGCVRVRTEARYVPFGYNHIVLLENGCSKAATCRVSTDVNPQPQSVDVASGKTLEVVTFAASPAQTFTPRVSCNLH